MPCATCCSAPSSNTENTTSPPPGLTPSRPDVRPPASPAPIPPRRSPTFMSCALILRQGLRATARTRPSPPRQRTALPQPLQHQALEHGDDGACGRAGIDRRIDDAEPLPAPQQVHDVRDGLAYPTRHLLVDHLVAQCFRPKLQRDAARP